MQIIADTATLYTPEEGKALGVTIIPVYVVIDGKSYKDLEEMSSEKFLELVEAGAVPTSSQPAIGDLIELFEQDEEEKLVLTVGDGLSGAYQNAMGARNTMEHGFQIPGRTSALSGTESPDFEGKGPEHVTDQGRTAEIH